MRTLDRIDRFVAAGHRLLAIVFALMLLGGAWLGAWPHVLLNACVLLFCMWRGGYWRRR